jgi:anti-anti-sigma factor
VSLKIQVTESRVFANTVQLHGRLDNNTVAALDEELDRIAADPAVSVVVLDLAGLDYISSVGLRSIFRLQKMMAARNGKALVVNPRPPVQKVFEIVNATDISAVFINDQELDDYLDLMQRKVAKGE